MSLCRLALLAGCVVALVTGSGRADDADTLAEKRRDGLQHLNKNEFRKALKLYREAHQLAVQIYGADTLEEATSLTDLSSALLPLGLLTEAEGHAKRAVEIRTAQDNQSLALAYAIRRLGQVSEALHGYREAEAQFRKALAIQEKVAPHGLDVAATRHTLAHLYTNNGLHQLALQEFDASYQIVKNESGGNTATVSHYVRCLGGCYRELKRYDESKAILDRAIRFQATRNPADPQTGITHYECGLLYRDLEQFEVAEGHFQKALAIWDQDDCSCHT